MKRCLTILLGVLLIAATAAPAIAWEFSMSGETEFRYRYFARQGENDLFGGPAGLGITGVPTGTIGLAGPMSFGGSTGAVLVQGFSAKGADASIADQRVLLFPEIRLNPAIRLRGEYWLTATNLRGNYFVPGNENTPNNWIQPWGYNGWYVIGDGSPGNGNIPNGMSMGLWERWWVTMQLPWGYVVMGRRPFPFGTGWDSLSERDVDSESFALICPYGPFRLAAGIYPRENGGDIFNENNINTIGSTVFAAGGTDKNRVRNPYFFVFMTYGSGTMEMGTMALFVSKNQAHTPVAAIVPAGPAARDDMSLDVFASLYLGSGRHATNPTVPIYGNLNWLLWPTYVKFNNGRFFFNALYAFEYADVHRNGGRPVYTWADAWQLEFGAMSGPAKLTLAGFYHSGDDRRGGLLDFTGATGQGNTGGSGTHPGTYTFDRQAKFLLLGGSEQAIGPYEFLLGVYGSGNNSYDQRGKCQFLDFLAYAARLDYAVAANLNVFGSFIYANRASNTGTSIASFNGLGGAVANPRAVFTTLPNGVMPNIPNNYLGWESDIGVNWKLLEGMTFNTLFAYWQPGDWFKWAYVDYSNTNRISIQGLNLPVDPNRGIDPIIGWQGSIVIDF